MSMTVDEATASDATEPETNNGDSVDNVKHSTDVVDKDVEDYLRDRNEGETFPEKRLKLIGIQRWKA